MSLSGSLFSSLANQLSLEFQASRLSVKEEFNAGRSGLN